MHNSGTQHTICSGLTVAFCIMARNCESAIENTLKEVSLAGTFFKSHHLFVVENNSTDATKELIRKFAEGKTDVSVAMTDFESESPNRIERITKARNTYLELVTKSDINPDILIAIDGDVSFRGSDIADAVENAPDNWTGLFAYGSYYYRIFNHTFSAYYYDVFAFVPLNGSYMLTEEQMHENGIVLDKTIKKNKYTACSSAFGGVGIYRYSLVKDKRYTLERNTAGHRMFYVCEHIPFNTSLLERGMNYICRDMKVEYAKVRIIQYIGYSIRKTFGSSVFRQIQSLCRKLGILKEENIKEDLQTEKML